MKDKEILAVGVLALFGIPAIIVASALVNGFVLTKLWSWFIVPQFSVATLRLPFAIGLSLVIGFLTYHGQNIKSEYKENGISQLFTSIVIRPVFVLFFGWIVTLFV